MKIWEKSDDQNQIYGSLKFIVVTFLKNAKFSNNNNKKNNKNFRKHVKPPKNQNGIKNSTGIMKIRPKNKKSCEEEEEQQQQEQQQELG